MNYTEAFAAYGATLTNPQWSVSAFGRDGSLVVCLWENYLKRRQRTRTLEYKDTLSAWLGNVPGRNEFRDHLRQVKSKGLKMRLIIAHPAALADAERVGKVADESVIKKTFSVKEDVLGAIEDFDDDMFRIVFERAA